MNTEARIEALTAELVALSPVAYPGSDAEYRMNLIYLELRDLGEDVQVID